MKPPKPSRSSKGRLSTAARGYGSAHQWQRRLALDAFVPGTPCARCTEPMLTDDPLDLDHTDDRDGYLGLSHAWCNRSHKSNGTARPPAWPPRSSCVMCGTPFRPRGRGHRACSRPCGTAYKQMNGAAV